MNSLLKFCGLMLLCLVCFWGEVALAVEFSDVEFAGKKFTVCKVNVQKERLQLFLNDDQGKPFGHLERLASVLASRKEHLIFGMNAGMYHADYKAVGLHVADGQELFPLNTANGVGNFFLKPNGVFLLNSKGAAQVVESSEYPTLKDGAMLASQSGPLMVHKGKLHPQFNEKSQSRHIRNGVGVPSADIALFVISEEPVTFYEFATLFRDKLKCPNALYFDGSVSSLYAPQLNRNDDRRALGPLIGVSTKDSADKK